MPIILKPGDVRNGYEVVRELIRGAFVIAYEARSSSGEAVLLKQFKSPTKVVEWYANYILHEQEIKERIEGNSVAKKYCYRFINFFEEGNSYFQAFEFISDGITLDTCIAHKDDFSWEQLILFARDTMSSVRALHEIGIIHSDLKPDNILLIPDPTLGMKYKLRIIDLEWAIFSDKKAPWHGVQGYVGTPRYQSPEHLSGKVPLLASDIFTCGIMLGELLGCGHPFAEEENYDQAAESGRFAPVHLRQEINKVDSAMLESVVNACLAPDPGKRPTAAQVCTALGQPT